MRNEFTLSELSPPIDFERGIVSLAQQIKHIKIFLSQGSAEEITAEPKGIIEK